MGQYYKYLNLPDSAINDEVFFDSLSKSSYKTYCANDFWPGYLTHDSLAFSNEFRKILEDKNCKIFKAETYSPKMLKTSSGLITGMWGGILSLLGVGVWGLTGNSEIGGAIKGVGEGLVDLFQVIPKEHWECKKTNYIRSGFSFIAGTSADIASRLMGNEPLLRDVCFFFVGIGRWLMSLSKAAGESN